MEVMNLWTSSSEYILTDAFPDTFPDLSVFDMRKQFEVRLYQQDSDDPYAWDGSFTIYGEVTSVEVVPEPATLILLGLGAVMVRKMRL